MRTACQDIQEAEVATSYQHYVERVERKKGLWCVVWLLVRILPDANQGFFLTEIFIDGY